MFRSVVVMTHEYRDMICSTTEAARIGCKRWLGLRGIPSCTKHLMAPFCETPTGLLSRHSSSSRHILGLWRRHAAPGHTATRVNWDMCPCCVHRTFDGNFTWIHQTWREILDANIWITATRWPVGVPEEHSAMSGAAIKEQLHATSTMVIQNRFKLGTLC